MSLESAVSSPEQRAPKAYSTVWNHNVGFFSEIQNNLYSRIILNYFYNHKTIRQYGENLQGGRVSSTNLKTSGDRP